MTRMRVALCAAMAAACAVAATPSSASVTVGQTAGPGMLGYYAYCYAGGEAWQKSVATGSDYVMPGHGIVTSWSSWADTAARNKLLILRETGEPSQFTLAAAGTAGSWSEDALNTTPVRIPVRAGDRVGVRAESDGATCAFNTNDLGDLMGFAYPSDTPLFGTVTMLMPNPTARVNLSVVWEPDADQDGYIDGTEDLCPDDASAHDAAGCNDAPTVAVAAADAVGDEGDTLATSGAFEDPDGDPVDVSATGAGDLVDNGDGTWSWSLATNDDASGSVTVTATDPHGETVSDTFDYSARNKPPAVLVAADDARGFEGETLSASGTFGDAVGDPLVLGASAPGRFTDNGDGTWTWDLATTDDVPAGAVTVTASDGDGGSASDTFEYEAKNVDPSIGEFAFSGPACAPTLGFSVADAGGGDTHSGSVAWGDGSGADAFSGSAFSGAHDYSSGGAGTYTVTASTSDDDGGTAERSATHTVHTDPSDLLQPINGTNKSSFKLGSTIPVKITVVDCLGLPVTALAPQVSVVHLDSTPSGTTYEATSTAAPTSGTSMRWDAGGGHYVYNLSTKPFQAGDWKVVVSDGSFAEPVTAAVSLRK